MTNNPFISLDKVKATINLNEAYDKEIGAIQKRRAMAQNWKKEYSSSFIMTNNPFAVLDKVKATFDLNEAYDKEIRAIQNRRVMVQNWKNEFNKQQREKAKKKFRGYE